MVFHQILGQFRYCPNICREIWQKVGSAGCDTPQKDDSAVYNTQRSCNNAFFLFWWCKRHRGMATPQCNKHCIMVTLRCIKHREWWLCGVSYTGELMSKHCFAIISAFLTLFKMIKNSKKLILKCDSMESQLGSVSFTMEWRLHGVSYTAEWQLHLVNCNCGPGWKQPRLSGTASILTKLPKFIVFHQIINCLTIIQPTNHQPCKSFNSLSYHHYSLKIIIIPSLPIKNHYHYRHTVIILSSLFIKIIIIPSLPIAKLSNHYHIIFTLCQFIIVPVKSLLCKH